ncbi:IS110 family transposase [Tetragenococcus halophilus]|uniref:IS110 family transposase n=1 Tax=Tetragenococcus halophilus TaxID=51669 RepID=UPI001F0B1F88|nr:IS110 family transposase [Tetragenococcus halophilus]
MALDISKGKSYMVVYKNEYCIEEREIVHTPEQFDKLLPFLKNNQVEVVFEATGVYSKCWEHFFTKNNFSYSCLNPLEAKLQIATMRQRKSDKNDAHQLAQTHLTNKRSKTFCHSNNYNELRMYSKLYDEVHSNLLVQRNYLHSELQLVFPGLEKIYSSNMTYFVLNIMDKYTHPDTVQKTSPTKIKNYILKQTGKKLSEKQAKEKALWLKFIAKEAYSVVEEDSFMVKEVKYRLKTIRSLKQQKDRISNELIHFAETCTEFKYIESIPGIGPLTAALLIAELGDIRRFDTHKQMNAYVGIDLRTYQSGTIQHKDKIQKRGNSRARMILFFTIQNMIKKQKNIRNHFIDYYYKLKKPPYVKKHKVAMIACMNKLLKTIHYLISNNEYYDYTKSPRG